MSTGMVVAPQPAHSFPALLKQHQSEIARALPRHLNPDRMTRIALTEFRKNPKLGECHPLSVFAAVVMAAQLGLEPGLMGQCYLIPYGKECQLIPGYQGLLDLVRRSGKVRRIEAQVVYTADHFVYRTGLSVTLEHEPLLDGDRGEPRLAYAVAEFAEGGYHVEIMGRAQIEAIRDRGSNAQNAKRYGKKTPWDTDTDEMWRKTVLRRLCKFLPKSVELAQAVALDDTAGSGQSQGLTIKDAAIGDWSPPLLQLEPPTGVNLETGEVVESDWADPAEAPNDPHAELLQRIAAAKTSDDLAALNKHIGRLRGDERVEVLVAWKAKRAEMGARP